jgi:hypothetical protein
MGKISTDAKSRYFERITEYKNEIENIVKREKNIQLTINSDENGAAYKKLTLADENLNVVSYFLLMNALSVQFLGVKNEAYLNDARKGCYKAIIYLEEVVSNYIDVPFSDYEDKLDKIDDFDDIRRFDLVRKLGFSIQYVADSFGDNSKWKWSFVEMDARFATVAKNLLNMKTIVSGMDPRVDGYETRILFLRLVKEQLQKAADRYREKYELSTLRLDDFKLAISYLNALRRVHAILGESDQAEVVKKKAEIWSSKMETDLKNIEQKSKEERLKR